VGIVVMLPGCPRCARYCSMTVDCVTLLLISFDKFECEEDTRFGGEVSDIER
jgi:hypothetical protein